MKEKIKDILVLVGFIAPIAIIIAYKMLPVMITDTTNEKVVEAIVTSKNYKEEHTFYRQIHVGDTWMSLPQTNKEKHLVTVEYSNITETFDSELLYNSVEEGEAVNIILFTAYNSKEEIVRQELRLPSEYKETE